MHNFNYCACIFLKPNHTSQGTSTCQKWLPIPVTFPPEYTNNLHPILQIHSKFMNLEQTLETPLQGQFAQCLAFNETPVYLLKVNLA